MASVVLATFSNVAPQLIIDPEGWNPRWDPEDFGQRFRNSEREKQGSVWKLLCNVLKEHRDVITATPWKKNSFVLY